MKLFDLIGENMEKIMIRTDNGQTYSVSAWEVAHNRATFYAQLELKKTESAEIYHEIYKDEYDFAIEEPDVLADWLLGNMNWYDMNPILEKNVSINLKDLRVEEVWTE